MPVTKKDFDSLRLQFSFGQGGKKIAVSAADVSFFGIGAYDVAHIRRSVAEMQNIIVFRKKSRQPLDALFVSVRIGQHHQSFHSRALYSSPSSFSARL